MGVGAAATPRHGLCGTSALCVKRGLLVAFCDLLGACTERGCGCSCTCVYTRSALKSAASDGHFVPGSAQAAVRRCRAPVRARTHDSLHHPACVCSMIQHVRGFVLNVCAKRLSTNKARRAKCVIERVRALVCSAQAPAGRANLPDSLIKLIRNTRSALLFYKGVDL